MENPRDILERSKKLLEKDRFALDSIDMQPVRSVGIYEAEFCYRNGDIIFHFWPYGYHAADHQGAPTPAFARGFRQALESCAKKTFGDSRVVLEDDRDVGALFLRAKGWGEDMMRRELSIKMCEMVHKKMGGSEG